MASGSEVISATHTHTHAHTHTHTDWRFDKHNFILESRPKTPNVTVKFLQLLLRIREDSFSSLEPETGYPG
jgi:hypothetical protein